jgi:YcaO-like protein with predicted kinase domain
VSTFVNWSAGESRKGFVTGTHRARPPEQTLASLLPRLSSFGITRVANVTGLDRIGIPVVMVCRPNSRSLATSQGKGLTLAAAKVSGIMESIELHHAEQVELPLLLGSYTELASARCLVEPRTLPAVPNTRYNDALQILWVEGYDLIQDRPTWLPFEVVHASAKVPPPPGSGCFSATSNGLASGNTLIEGLLHALFEAIERDATTLWERRSPQAKADSELDLSSVDDPGCGQVIDACRAAGVEVSVWETTSDVGVPSFLCEIADANPSGDAESAPFVGMGTHASPRIALLRALTEAVQCRVTLISGSRDDLFRREYSNQRRSERVPAAREGIKRRFDRVEDLSRDTFEAELRTTLDRLVAVGLTSVIAVDLTKPEFQIPVVRVVVPGLEGPDDDAEYVPGPRARRIEES